jgi:DNA-directed RNA polymerase specialized sigma24 family protein
MMERESGGMNATPPGRWNLDSEAFEHLLAALGDDRESASREYEAIRRRLIHFFDWASVQSPDVLADQTLDRLARKLQEGEGITNPRGYAVGIARYVLQEYLARQKQERRALDAAPRTPATVAAPDTAQADMHCLEKCLSELPPDSRRVIVAYYEGEGQIHLSERKALAEKLNLTYAALKKRAHRARGLLAVCLAACLEGRKTGHR